MLVLLDVVGWVGGGAVAVAYVLVSARRLAPGSTMFQLLNVVGAAMLGVACLQQDALPSAGLNLVWVAVGSHALATGAARRSRVDRVAADLDAAPSLTLAAPHRAPLSRQTSSG